MMNLPTPEQLIQRLSEQLAPVLSADTALVGMHTGGVWVMEAVIARLSLHHLDHGTVDTSFYRDDYAKRGLHDGVKPSRLPFEIEGRRILLIDDVLNTGRSVRAAINLLFDYGRPAAVRLAVLVDRGGRELPVCADFAGIRLELPRAQRIHLERDATDTLSLVIVDIPPEART